MNITAPQLRRLQVLYGQYCHHSLDTGNSREDRLAFASARIGRTIVSYSDLTLEEGKKLIDGLQAALGVALPSKTPRRRQTRRDGEKAGTEGRHDQIHDEATLVGDKDIRRIQREMDRLAGTKPVWTPSWPRHAAPTPAAPPSAPSAKPTASTGRSSTSPHKRSSVTPANSP